MAKAKKRRSGRSKVSVKNNRKATNKRSTPRWGPLKQHWRSNLSVAANMRRVGLAADPNANANATAKQKTNKHTKSKANKRAKSEGEGESKSPSTGTVSAAAACLFGENVDAITGNVCCCCCRLAI